MKESKEKIIKPEIFIFDMDGTLYELDGDNGTFKNSTLFKNIIANSIQFVLDREVSTQNAAEKLIQDALKDEIGISNVMAKRYGITRGDYFDVAWDINPAPILRNFQPGVEAVRTLKTRKKRLFLLTAAPRVWMENVLKTLGLENSFERKINGEEFASKQEVFKKLAQEFSPTTLLSVGDQLDTDILPAELLGMQTFQVKKTADLLKLL